MPFDMLLVDDHQIVRDGVKAILSRCDDFRVVAEFETGSAAIQYCKHNTPQMVLMDLSLPGLNGIETTAELVRIVPSIRVVVLSMYDDEQSVVGAIRAGARGFVLKKASFTDLIDALRTVAKGGSYLSPQVSDRLLSRIQRGDIESQAGPSVLDGLSPRELQVLRMVAEGMSSKEIATSLGLELETIRSYRKTMMRKLGVNNVASLTHLALAAGLTPLTPQPRQ